MILTLKRIAKQPTYTIGRLFINNVYFCDTLEDKDRDLSNDMSLEAIKSQKVYGETAIPLGSYKIDMSTVSHKFKSRSWAKLSGIVPRLLNVKGFEGVLIHPGNSTDDTLGCILVGQNTIKGQVTNSANTYKALYAKLEAAHKNGKTITINIC